MDFYKETKSSSLNYTMLLKYSLTQTDSLAIKSLYIGFLFLAQNRRELKQIVLIKLYTEFLFCQFSANIEMAFSDIVSFDKNLRLNTHTFRLLCLYIKF